MEPQDRHAGKCQLEGTLIPGEHPEMSPLSSTNKDHAKGAYMFVLLENSVTSYDGGLFKVQNPRKSQTRRLPEGQELLGGFGSEMRQWTSLAGAGKSLVCVPLLTLVITQQGSCLVLSVSLLPGLFLPFP